MSCPDGYSLRDADPRDAAALLAFGRQLLGETVFFLRGPAERATDSGEMADIVRSFAETPGAAMLTAWTAPAGDAAAEPVGEAVLIPGRLARTRRTATVGVGVLAAHWGRGLGRALMAEIEARARRAGLRRLELTVVAPNSRAMAMYDRLGYVREGVKRRSVELPEHGWVDETLMAKLLDAG